MRYALPLMLSLLALPATAQDVAKGKEINGTCAGCHGEYGSGGKKGEYPRLAGQRGAYIEKSLRSFRARTRINIPMFPYTQERELTDDDIADVAAYLASIELPTKWPEFKASDDALVRLTATEKVMIIPRVDGNIDNGKVIFQKQCASCHGKTGMGRGKFPMLVGQYTNYLMRQMEAYIKGERAHDEDDSRGVLATLNPTDLQDVLAYITTLQDRQD